VLVVQPAVKRLRILYAQMDYGSWRKEREVQEVATGLRMALLYDMVLGKVSQFHVLFMLFKNIFDV